MRLCLKLALFDTILQTNIHVSQSNLWTMSHWQWHVNVHEITAIQTPWSWAWLRCRRQLCRKQRAAKPSWKANTIYRRANQSCIKRWNPYQERGSKGHETKFNPNVLPLTSSLQISNDHFYRTHVYMGSDLWVMVSLTQWVQDLVET